MDKDKGRAKITNKVRTAQFHIINVFSELEDQI
jgi:hypothetical protein